MKRIAIGCFLFIVLLATTSGRTLAESCYPNLPAPDLVVMGTEDYMAQGEECTRYLMTVRNWLSFPDELFEPAPYLPPCGLNSNASRTWVMIYAADGSRIYGFCALPAANWLTRIWFGLRRGEPPPEYVYIEIIDRLCEITYTSNLASTAPGVYTVSTPNTPSGPSEGQVGESLPFFTGGSSCNQGHPVQYRFDWGDGNYSNWSSSTSTSYAYSNADTYQIRAQAQCSSDTSVVSNWSSPKTVNIGVPPPSENVPPIADAGPGQTLFDTDGDEQEDVTLDGSGSSDPDGDPLTYVWTEDGTQIATGANPTVKLSTGSHAITLTVTDDNGATDTDKVGIIIGIKKELNCKIELRKQDSSTLIDTIDINEYFDIYVGASTGDIGRVRFSSDEIQDARPTGEWTNWFAWDRSSADWNAPTKINPWAFVTDGEREIWAEIEGREGGCYRCSASMSVQETAGPKDAGKAELAEALWALKDTMLQKVAFDVSVTAQAFTNVKDYWRVKRWADIFRVPLRILEDTVSILARLTDWRNIKHLSGSEAACQVLLTMAMIQDLRQVGNNLVCALDGPAYIESVKRMLEAADATTAFRDFSPTHYRWVVENWLNGLGEIPVLLLPEKVTRGVKQGFVAGALAVKLNIANQFNNLTTNVLNTDFPAGFPFEEVTTQIKEIARKIIASSTAEQTIEYPLPSTRESQFRETKLGAVAGLYRAFGEVAGCVAEHIQLQQTVEVIKLLETGTNAILLYTITHKIPGTEDVRVAQQVFTLAGVLTGSYVHTFIETPENRFYALPQEMLLMLPVELTNLWMVADGVVSYIEDSLRFVLNDAGVKQEKIAFISLRDGNPEIYVMNADGSNQQRLTNNPAADLYHAWSPDGGKIAFTSDRDGNSEIYVMNADGSNQQRLTSNSAFDYRPKWSPDGTKILFESRSNDDMDYDICMINADGTNERNLTNRPTIIDGLPGWSPDGSGILFVSNKDGDTELLVMNPDGTNERNLTDNLYNDWYGVYSPDGRKIAYWDGRAGEYDIYIMDADGRNKYPLLPENLHWEMLLGWVPNTNTVVFALYRTTHYDVYTINLDGTGQRFLASVAVDDYSVSWSPSGKKVAFTSDRDGNYAIYVMDADGSNLQRLTNNPDGDANPVWSPILPE